MCIGLRVAPSRLPSVGLCSGWARWINAITASVSGHPFSSISERPRADVALSGKTALLDPIASKSRLKERVVSKIFYVRRLVFVCLTTLMVVTMATAFACAPIGLPNARYVGNTATDSSCTDNDIQSAISNVTCSNTTIYITDEHTYTAQHLTIGRSMSLVGLASGVKCNAPPPICGNPPCVVQPTTAPLIEIDGTGHTGDSVVSIKGDASVELKYLQITGGQEGDSGHGGGIYFDGYGTLTLDVDTINANKAGYGAGLYVNGDGGQANVRINDYVQIIGNTAAHDGGGVMAEGNARIYALGSPVLISVNHAPNGNGGGIQVVGPARADIGAAGYGALGVLYDNDASYGGGMSVVASANGNAVARLFTTNAESSVAVQANRATVAGGAFYFHPLVTGTLAPSFNEAYGCVFNARIDSNVAPEGAAAYLEYSSATVGANEGSALYFNPVGLDADNLYQSLDGIPVSPCGPETAASLGAVACAADATCNEVSRNLAINGSDESSGSVFYSSDNTILLLNHMTMRNSQGNYAFNAADSYFLGLQTCLVADNQLTQQLLLASGGPAITINDATIAHDVIDATHLMKIGSSVRLTMLDDIVDEAGTLTLDQPGSLSGNANLSLSYVLTNDATTLPVTATIVQGDPLFADAATGNYHLSAYRQNGILTVSPAIDFALPVSGDDRDLDGLAFDQDVPSVADHFGVRDLGAYEMQPIVDRIFADGYGDKLTIVY
jgi:hypothetical protein